MKKINSIISIVLLTCIFMFSNCSEADFDEKYRDPGKSSSVDLEKLLPGTLLWSRDWAMSTYGRFFGWESQVLMKQANTVGITLEGTAFYDLEGYTDGMPPYGDLAKLISSYRFMQATYETLPEGEKADKEVYLLAAETQMYAMMAYIMSNFGDIPFDEVGQVAVTQDVATAHPHFQDDQQLYALILDNLGTLNTKFAAITNPDPLFKSQDIINKGSIDKWQRYVNSIRLRVALLVSTNGPLASKGQGVLKEILENSSKYPVIENNDQNTCMAQVNTGGSALDIDGGSGFDWLNQRTASKEIIKRMQKAGDGGVWVQGQDDPRLPIMFCLATANAEFAVDQFNSEDHAEAPSAQFPNGKAIPTVFRGLSADSDPAEMPILYAQPTRAKYSYIREQGFFKSNRNWDNPIITAAEVNFIKAEAFQRGWASGNAKAAFTKAIEQSIAFYFKYQSSRTTDQANIGGTTSANISFRTVIPSKKSEDAAWIASFTPAWITSFAEARWTSRVDGSSYTGGSLEAILEQKWLNFGYMYSGEQWNDLRRTGYPWMYYQRDIDPIAQCPVPRNRSRYPESERTHNMNFEQVSAQDNFKDVLFWAIPDGTWHDGPTK